jgi:hypothetical protein
VWRFVGPAILLGINYRTSTNKTFAWPAAGGLRYPPGYLKDAPKDVVNNPLPGVTVHSVKMKNGSNKERALHRSGLALVLIRGLYIWIIFVLCDFVLDLVIFVSLK